jgi:hypothetical protein
MVGGGCLDRLGVWGIAAFVLLEGAAQWLVLRSCATIGPVWIPLTAIGLAMGFGIGTVVGMIAGFLGYAVINLTRLGVLLPAPATFVVFLVDFFVVGAGAGGLAMGYVLGVIQRPVWKANALPPDRWLAASMLGGAAAIGATGIDLLDRGLREFYGAMYPEMPTGLYPSGWVSGMVFGLLYGAITGIALARRQQQASDVPNRVA